jgi:hypothetical protein
MQLLVEADAETFASSSGVAPDAPLMGELLG